MNACIQTKVNEPISRSLGMNLLTDVILNFIN